LELGLKLILVAVIGYLLGSANTSLIVGKFYGVDVRKHGSGNAGMTNTLRTLGKVAALLVILGDVLKGIVAYLIGYYVVGAVNDSYYLGGMVGGICAIIGHIWPVYFKFKGGKGVLTTLSVLLMMDWKIGLLLFGVFLVILAITRYVSLGSMIGAALFPLVSLVPLFHKPPVFIAFAALLAALVIFMHRTNIRRLANGTESKFGLKKKK
jgi:acyl phosphate:glycerol-3-phosphate acyltransferase